MPCCRRLSPLSYGVSVQSEAAADLTPVLEVAIEHLVGENLGGLRPDGLELDQQSGLGRNRAFRRLTICCAVLRFDRLDLLVRHQQPLMLAPDLVSQTRRYGTPVAGAHLIEIRQEVRHQWLGIADPLPMQKPLDPIGVPGALREQPLALARPALAILVLRRRDPNHAADPGLARVPRRDEGKSKKKPPFSPYPMALPRAGRDTASSHDMAFVQTG